MGELSSPPILIGWEDSSSNPFRVKGVDVLTGDKEEKSTTREAVVTMSQQIIKLTLKGTLLNAVQTRNVFYYGADTTTPGGQQADELGVQVEDIAADVVDIAAPAINFYQIDSSYWDGVAWQPIQEVTIDQTGGNTGSDMSSYQTSGLMRATTSVLKAVGRKFIPGIAESVTQDSQFIQGVAIYLVQLLADYIATVQVQFVNWYPGVPSKNSAFAPFTSATFSSLLSTMRRRKPGYGI
jgi:hypothetical protein